MPRCCNSLSLSECVMAIAASVAQAAAVREEAAFSGVGNAVAMTAVAVMMIMIVPVVAIGSTRSVLPAWVMVNTRKLRVLTPLAVIQVAVLFVVGIA